ncbi:hypothetical protein Droror1_Dr00021328 [Drosera rotundifolia]
MFSVMIDPSSEKVAEVAMILWSMWNNRNARVHGSQTKPASLILLLAKRLAEEFTKFAATQASITATKWNRHNVKWELPPPRRLKVNAYTSIRGQGAASLGVIIGSHEGSLVAAGGKTIGMMLQPVVAEALETKLVGTHQYIQDGDPQI